MQATGMSAARAQSTPHLCVHSLPCRVQSSKRAASRDLRPRTSKVVVRSGGNNASDNGAGNKQSQSDERFISVSDLLDEVKDMGEDFVFEDKDEASDVWSHEQRLRQNAGDAAPSEVKNALDPDQGNVISAYSSDSGFKETTVDDVHEAMQTAVTGEVLFLDVRTPREYVAGHAPDAINIELDALSEAVRAGTLVDWEEQGQIVVICGSGKRSAQAAVRLSKVFNFKDVINVKGGMQEWAAAGYEVQTGEGMTLDAPPHLL